MNKQKTGHRRWQYTLDLHQDVSHHFDHKTITVNLSYDQGISWNAQGYWMMSMNETGSSSRYGYGDTSLGSFSKVDPEKLLKGERELYKSDCINDAEFMGSREEIISRAVKYHFDRIEFAESDEGKALREEIKSFEAEKENLNAEIKDITGKVWQLEQAFKLEPQKEGK